MYQDINKVCKELEKIFGIEATEKVFSHLSSCNNREKELIVSRDKWKAKYLVLKNSQDGRGTKE